MGAGVHVFTDCVFLEHTSGGRDCDGPISYYTDLWCRLDQLNTGNEYKGIHYADWKREDSQVYDAYAQAANY